VLEDPPVRATRVVTLKADPLIGNEPKATAANVDREVVPVQLRDARAAVGQAV